MKQKAKKQKTTTVKEYFEDIDQSCKRLNYVIDKLYDATTVGKTNYPRIGVQWRRDYKGKVKSWEVVSYHDFYSEIIGEFDTLNKALAFIRKSLS